MVVAATTGTAVAASAVGVSIVATLIAVIVTFLVAVICTVVVLLIWRRKVFKKIEASQNIMHTVGTDKTIENMNDSDKRGSDRSSMNKIYP